MKEIITSDIAQGIRMPFSNRSLDHLQEAYKEAIGAVLKGLITDPTGVTIIHGAVLSGVSPSYSITAGAVYYAGEVFLVDATDVAVAGGQTLVWTIEETYREGDPVIFTDNNNRNIHLIRKMKLVTAVSGSGVGDFEASVRYGEKVWIDVPAANGWQTTLQYSIFSGRLELRGTAFGVNATSSIIADDLPDEFANCYIPAVKDAGPESFTILRYIGSTLVAEEWSETNKNFILNFNTISIAKEQV